MNTDDHSAATPLKKAASADSDAPDLKVLNAQILNLFPEMARLYESLRSGSARKPLISDVPVYHNEPGTPHLPALPVFDSAFPEF